LPCHRPLVTTQNKLLILRTVASYLLSGRILKNKWHSFTTHQGVRHSLKQVALIYHPSRSETFSKTNGTHLPPIKEWDILWNKWHSFMSYPKDRFYNRFITRNLCITLMEGLYPEAEKLGHISIPWDFRTCNISTKCILLVKTHSSWITPPAKLIFSVFPVNRNKSLECVLRMQPQIYISLITN
jgi:hypothetical protein